MASLTSVFLHEECNLIHVLKSYKKNYLSYWCYSVLYSYIAAQTIRKDEEGTHTSMLNTFMLWGFVYHTGYMKVIRIAAWYLGKL